MATKNIFISALFLIGSLGLQAQDTAAKRIREYGLGFSNLNSYAFQYRWGTEKKLKRVTLLFDSNSEFGKNTSSYTNTDTTFKAVTRENSYRVPISFDLGANYSVFHLKAVNERFGFLYGAQAGLFTNFNQSIRSTPQFTQSATVIGANEQKQSDFNAYLNLGMVLGLSYKINTNFYLYAEIFPHVYYNQRLLKSETTNYTADKKDASTSSNTNYSSRFGLADISNSGATMTIAYRLYR